MGKDRAVTPSVARCGGDTRRRTVALGVGTGRKVTVFTHPPAREALPDTTRVKKPVTRPSLSVRSLVGLSVLVLSCTRN